MTTVNLYSADWCPSCRVMKDKLEQNGIEYTLIDVDANPEALDGLRSEGIRTIPVLERVHDDGNVKRYVGLPHLQEFLRAS